MTRMLSSAVGVRNDDRSEPCVRSLRSSFVRIDHGRLSLLSIAGGSSTSQGMAAVLSSSSSTVSVLLPRNGSRSTGTSRLKSVRPICASVLVSFEAVGTRLRMSAHLHGLRTDLAARALGVDGVDDLARGRPSVLSDERADEVVVGATIVRRPAAGAARRFRSAMVGSTV